MSRIELPEGIALDDPRPIAAGAPYTFFLPHPDELAAVRPGDGIQAIFREIAGGRGYDAERMWVLVERIEDGDVIGTLDNEPIDMELIKLGDPVRIPITHAINTQLRGDGARPHVPVRQYCERCLVDDCVVAGRCHADYLYREQPDMTREGDKYEDSGWRIRGTDSAIEEDRLAGREPHYIALGKVLNADDRWLHLIDREIGVAFQWDPDASDYIELD